MADPQSNMKRQRLTADDQAVGEQEPGGAKNAPMEQHVRSVLLLLARSGFVNCESLVWLAKTCSTLHKAIITDETGTYAMSKGGSDENSIWAAMNKHYNLEQHGITPEVTQRLGCLWAFQQVLRPSSRRVRQPIVGPPSLDMDQMEIMFSISYHGPDGANEFRSSSLSGIIDWKEILRKDEHTIDFRDNPILLGEALITDDDDGDVVCLEPTDHFENSEEWLQNHTFRVHARLLRLTDNKTFCIYESSEGIREWEYLWVAVVPHLVQEEGSPSIDDLDLSHPENEPGMIDLNVRCLKEQFLPVSGDTKQGAMIKDKFQFEVFFCARLRVEALPNKKLGVTGLRFNLVLVDPDNVEYDDHGYYGRLCGFNDSDLDTKGVTLQHILSNLQLPE